MKNILIALFVLFALVSCDEESQISVVYPKDYLPAYPGSYWNYSNGERSMVHTSYVTHSYQSTLNSAANTSEKMVPFMDQKYLYEYSISQNSTAYPLKKLLTETVTSSAWKVNENVSGQTIYRKTIAALDSLYINFNYNGSKIDTFYTNVVVVVEFSSKQDADNWYLKEYYAKNVGLVQTEVNNPYDTLPSIIQKQLISFDIKN